MATPIRVLLFRACLLATQPASAQGLEIDWFSIDGGGITFATGSGFELGATIGQPDAVQLLSGSGFELTGGFWAIDESAAPPCIGDLTGDGLVGLDDLTRLLSNFGTASGATFAMGDSDADGDVDLGDLSALLSNFGTTCP